jgi:hypothetical protein
MQSTQGGMSKIIYIVQAYARAFGLLSCACTRMLVCVCAWCACMHVCVRKVCMCVRGVCKVHVRACVIYRLYDMVLYAVDTVCLLSLSSKNI